MGVNTDTRTQGSGHTGFGPRAASGPLASQSEQRFNQQTYTSLSEEGYTSRMRAYFQLVDHAPPPSSTPPRASRAAPLTSRPRARLQVPSLCWSKPE